LRFARAREGLEERDKYPEDAAHKETELDSNSGEIVGDDEANQRLAYHYREPWTHRTPETV
jgi:hypothetical protein